MRIAQEVCKKSASKYKFAYYDYDDIIQESLLSCYKVFEKYDGRVPLENFLSKHVNNRMKNLKRDKYYRPFKCTCSGDCEKCVKRTESRNKKKNTLDCTDISTIKDEVEFNMRFYEDIGTEIDIQEMQELIDQSMPSEYRDDYLKYKAGIKISSVKKQQIETIIFSIIL